VKLHVNLEIFCPANANDFCLTKKITLEVYLLPWRTLTSFVSNLATLFQHIFIPCSSNYLLSPFCHPAGSPIDLWHTFLVGMPQPCLSTYRKAYTSGTMQKSRSEEVLGMPLPVYFTFTSFSDLQKVMR
jgi:hypothetical protein